MSHPTNIATVRVTDVSSTSGPSTRIIELNRPAKLNCLGLEMLDEVLRALDGAGNRRIVLTGAGRAFCTGLDLNEVAGPDGGRQHLQRLTAIYRWLLKTENSTVVFARGHVVGGGVGLMACAKTVIVTGDIRLHVPGDRLARLAAVVVPVCHRRTGGKTPGDAGWLGCKLDAEAARQLGLVDRVVSPAGLDELVAAARNGKIAPEFLSPAPRSEPAVVFAVAGLDSFLENFG